VGIGKEDELQGSLWSIDVASAMIKRRKINYTNEQKKG
jgi:hypothetical protein